MKSTKNSKPPIQIFVLQRGWVVLGRAKTSKDQTTIESAAVVRRWGTTAGLGQLASQGKQPNTVLDECPPVRVHPAAVVLVIDCDQSKWTERA